MNIHSFLLNFFVPALSGYLPHASHCEINQQQSKPWNKYTNRHLGTVNSPSKTLDIAIQNSQKI